MAPPRTIKISGFFTLAVNQKPGNWKSVNHRAFSRGRTLVHTQKCKGGDFIRRLRHPLLLQ